MWNESGEPRPTLERFALWATMILWLEVDKTIKRRGREGVETGTPATDVVLTAGCVSEAKEDGTR